MDWVSPLKFQKFLTLPMDGNYSSKYKETSTIAIKHNPKLSRSQGGGGGKGESKLCPVKNSPSSAGQIHSTQELLPDLPGEFNIRAQGSDGNLLDQKQCANIINVSCYFLRTSD